MSCALAAELAHSLTREDGKVNGLGRLCVCECVSSREEQQWTKPHQGASKGRLCLTDA
jgi:hypothetical protein